jgi:eukaryotic-like serine/threonine-protein kinase
MLFGAGKTLGPYEIHSPLGAGGMGEVYRAHDSRLGRDVAVKILPESLANDTERLQRFKHEARVLGALNHPNLLAIYDVGEERGIHYLVSEYLEGRTLRDRVADAPLSQRQILEFSVAIAKGLAAAHEKGIVHRDLKPENILITKNEQVKVLDFGLAKLSANLGSQDATLSLESQANTKVGSVVGTVGYMSPEQVRCSSLDARSDIFSFGVVLYEMLTRTRAFQRDTAAETMTAILKEDPPALTDDNWRCSPALKRIVCRCLEKNVDRRFQSTSDLGFAIESLSGSVTSLPAFTPEKKKLRMGWILTAAAVAALTVLIWISFGRPSSAPVAKFTRISFQQGFVSNARFAPGGDSIVYSAQWGNEPMRIYSVRREFPQSVKVDLPSAALLALSSKGDLLLSQDPTYTAALLSGTMAQAPIAGGAPRSIEEGVICADYSSDGNQRAVARHANGQVQLEYPAGHVIYTTGGFLDYVRISPNGKDVAFLEHPVYDDDFGSVALIDSTGNHRKLTEEFRGALQGLAWSPSGKELWFTAAREGADLQLFAVTLSGKQRAVLGAPHRTRIFDIASDGRLLLSNEQYRREIVGVKPGDGNVAQRLEWFNTSGMVDIAADGKAITFVEYVGPLYLVAYRKLDGSPPIALGPGAWPKLSPDGATVAAVLLSHPPQLALHPLRTGESRNLDLADVVDVIRVSWFPDGKHLLFIGAKEGQHLRTYKIGVDANKPEELGPAGFTGFAVSGDGKQIAGRTAEGRPAVLNLESQKLDVVSGIEPGERFEKWSQDGKALIVTSTTPWAAQIYRVEVSTGKRTMLQRIELSEKAGSNLNLGVTYAENSKAYVYYTRRVLGTLYIVEGLR